MCLFFMHERRKMQLQSNRKKLVSIGIEEKDAEILQNHAVSLRRSFSETVRLILEDYIEKNNLEQKYGIN